MKKSLLIFGLFLSSLAYSQVGLLNNYHFNYLSTNPALAGENGPFTIKAIMNNQFNGNLRFNQLSHVLALDGQLYNKLGIAFMYSSDNYGTGVGNDLGLSLAKGFELGDLKIKAGINGSTYLMPSALGLGNSGTRADFSLGAGGMASFMGAFIGISQPKTLTTKNSFTGKSPTYLNLGYTSQSDDFVTFNANTLIGLYNGMNNYDFNLKLWFNKVMALGGSYRINNIYRNYSKKNSFLPSLEYKITDDILVGLAYNPNSLRLSNTSQNTPQNFNLNGMFQFYLRYNQSDRKGDSWYYDQF